MQITNNVEVKQAVLPYANTTIKKLDYSIQFLELMIKAFPSNNQNSRYQARLDELRAERALYVPVTIERSLI